MELQLLNIPEDTSTEEVELLLRNQTRQPVKIQVLSSHSVEPSQVITVLAGYSEWSALLGAMVGGAVWDVAKKSGAYAAKELSRLFAAIQRSNPMVRLVLGVPLPQRGHASFPIGGGGEDALFLDVSEFARLLPAMNRFLEELAPSPPTFGVKFIKKGQLVIAQWVDSKTNEVMSRPLG